MKENVLLTGVWIYKIVTGNYLTSDFFFVCRTTLFEKDVFNIPELNATDLKNFIDVMIDDDLITPHNIIEVEDNPFENKIKKDN